MADQYAIMDGGRRVLAAAVEVSRETGVSIRQLLNQVEFVADCCDELADEEGEGEVAIAAFERLLTERAELR